MHEVSWSVVELALEPGALPNALPCNWDTWDLRMLSIVPAGLGLGTWQAAEPCILSYFLAVGRVQARSGESTPTDRSQMEIHIWESLEYHENWSSECGRNYLVRLCKLEREENQRQTLGKLAFKAQVEEECLWKKLRSNLGGKPGDKGRRKWFTCSGVYTSRSFKYFWPGFFILKTKD